MGNKGKGWHKDSRRHSLARKGVSTVLPDGRKLPVNRFIAGGSIEYDKKVINRIMNIHDKRTLTKLNSKELDLLIAYFTTRKLTPHELYIEEWYDRFQEGTEWQLSDGDGRKLLKELAPEIYVLDVDESGFRKGDRLYTRKEFREKFPFASYGKEKIKYLGVGRSMHGYLDRSWDEFLYKVNGEEVSIIIFREPDFEAIREGAVEEGVLTKEEYEEYVQEESMEFYKKDQGEVHVIWEGALDFTGNEEEFKNQYPDLYKDIEGELG